MSTIVSGTIISWWSETCTIENYIVEKFIDPLQISGNTSGSVQSSASQQFNNQAIQSQPNILADRIPGLVDNKNINFFLTIYIPNDGYYMLLLVV
jgi:hypothetical protein